MNSPFKPARWMTALLFLCLSFVITAASAQDLLPLDPAVRLGKLPNGLTYYIRKNTKPEKRVELRLAVNTGSVQEDADQIGMAHFVEHMCFRGTTHFPGQEVIHYLQSVGAAFGPEINAYTSFDETVYKLTLPSDKEEILGKGLLIMQDWAAAVTFDDNLIDKERSVIVEEWRLGRGAQQRMQDKFIPVLFSGSKYAERLPIGTKESIETSTHEAIKRFYKTWYRPDNMAFIVVGDIDPDKIEASIKEGFGKIPASPAGARAVAKIQVPDHTEPLYSIVSDKENTHNSALLVWGTERKEIRTTSDFRASLLSGLFTSMLNQRLVELTQQANPPFLGAGSQQGRFFSRAKDAFLVSVSFQDGGLDRAMTATLTETERVRRHGFTEAELARTKKNLFRSIEQAYKERDKTQSEQLVGDYVDHFLTGAGAPSIEWVYEYAKANIEGITLSEINPLITKFITAENRVTVLMGVEKEGFTLPTETQLAAITKAVADSKIDPYSEKKMADSLMASKPTPGKIIATRKVEELGTTELELSNGITVVLKPTKFQNDEILFTAFKKGGQSNYPVEYKLSGMLAANYLGEAGLGSFNKIDLMKLLAGKKAGARASIGLYYDSVSGGCSAADMETMFQLIHLGCTQPRRDEQALASMSTRVRASLKNALGNPVAFFRNESQKIQYKNHPRDTSPLPSEEDWSNLSLDRIMTLLQGNLGNAHGFTFILVGSFEEQAVLPLIETYLASLPSKPGTPAYQDLGIRSVKGPFDHEILKGSDPKSLVTFFLDGDTPYSLEEAHLLGSLGNILERIYTDKLREEMGGVYGLNVVAEIARTPRDNFYFRLTIPCAPDNVDKLLNAALDEIRRIQKEGLKPEELQKEIESQRRIFEKNAKENRAWLAGLDSIRKYGEDNTRLAHPDKLIGLLTPEALQRVAVKYLDISKGVRFTLYPENYDKSKSAAPATPAATK